MNRYVAGAGAVLIFAGLWWVLRAPPALGEAYAAERISTVWSRMSQVREPVATVRYGSRLTILERRGESIRVRTESNATGWMEERRTLPPHIWQRGLDLRQKARSLTPFARGRTKVVTNVRLEPGRTTDRVFQFQAEVPVDVVAREVREWTPPAAAEPSGETDTDPGKQTEAAPTPASRREDWVLVRGVQKEDAEIAGWVLRKRLALSYPLPLRDYGAGIRFVGWYELSEVIDVDGPKPTYLALAVTGGEGQPCDFTLLRVYGWDSRRRVYVASFVDSRFCGRFPVSLRRSQKDVRDVTFVFASTGPRGEENREYRAQNTWVRRIRTARPARKGP